MKKYIVTCSRCKKKMKIMGKYANYKCPSCEKIYKLTRLKKFKLNIGEIFNNIFNVIKNIKNNIVQKYKNTKATYKYMKQMRANMKSNPNWSNYHSEKAREKSMKEAKKPKIWDKFKKNN